ncbi:MAG: zinc-ribbon and DUF3426 domain-containing protein [Proteobacteria bacterium]|nr:zinc-ribbon and DUF3426 domain-containing protein [Pseudomonadota bacterium]
MILARCPACSTTFRVQPEQLNARHGRVRCGQCKHAFNALENQVEEEALVDDLLPPDPTSPPIAEQADAPLFVLQEIPSEAPALSMEDGEDTATPADGPSTLSSSPADTEIIPDDLLAGEDVTPADTAPADQPAIPDDLDFLALDDTDAQPPLPEAGDERIEPSGEILPESFDAWSVPDEAGAAAPAEPMLDEQALDDDAPLEDHDEEAGPSTIPPFPFKPDWPDASELDLKNPPDASLIEESPLDFDSLLHKQVVDDTPGTPVQALDQDLPTAAAADAPQAVVGLPIEAPPAPADTSEPTDNEQDEPEAFAEEAAEEAAEEPAGPSALQQAAWAAGATLLVLTLLAQGVLVFRSDIAAASPQMRLFMESVCAGMGCDLPLPRESASITIESSDIQPDANREAFFTLHATLRNRAEFAQAWPHLEITLTDARDKALVRRVLDPKQWLPADMPPDAFPARKEVAARVRFEAPGVAAAGYRVYAFYP